MITEIGEAASGSEALHCLRLSQWHLLTLDINMPDLNGLDILSNVIASYPDTKVLILSGLPERRYAELAQTQESASTYRSRIMGKMHLLTNADITTYALKNELIL
jgi:two-component system response regulator YesN